jgi:hypothetical protein
MPHPPTPVPTAGFFQKLWSQHIAVSPRGLALAREKKWLLAWDDKSWLYLLKQSGERQGQFRAPDSLTTACCADDGSSFAAAGSHGQIWWLAPDLSVRWERSMPAAVVAAAMDSFGQYLAVADARGQVHIFDRHGRLLIESESARPLFQLAFVPAAPYLIGSADFGLVACIDLKGTWIWRDGLVAHIGSLSVDGVGERVVLACYSEGLLHYSVKNRNQGRLAIAEPCRLAAVAYDGNRILASGLGNHLFVLDQDGRVIHTHPLEEPAVALALSPLGDTAFVAQAGGTLLGFRLQAGP